MSSPQMFTFSWSELTSSLASTAQQLHLDGDLVDVTLSAGGKIFHAHKLVLSAASPLLMEMLKSTKCTNPVVLLAGVAADDLEAILQFIYHGEVTIDPIRLPCLLQAAQHLDIRALSPPPSFDKIVPSSVHSSASDFHQVGMIPATNPNSTAKKRRRSNVKVLPKNAEENNGYPNDHYISDIGMDQSLNEGDPSEISVRRASIVSDLPVSCHICRAVIRQSRNLRRHMELVHMRTDNSHRTPKKKKDVGTASSSLESSSPSVERPEIHKESPANDTGCYVPSAQRVLDPFEETANRNHLDSSQDSRSPPNLSQATDLNQAQPAAGAPPADHPANSSTSSAPSEVPPWPAGYAAGNINISHLIPPQPKTSSLQASSVQRLNEFHDTRDDNS